MFSRFGNLAVQSCSPFLRQCTTSAFSTSVLRSHNFNSSTTAAEVVKGLDLTDKTILITGATAGIGEETARVLASRGAHLILLNRNPEKANRLHENLVELTNGKARVDFLTMDLSSLQSVRDAADEILRSGWKLDSVILNGGAFAPPAHCTVDGLETHFGANYLAHFYLCTLLRDRLRESRARIVLMSSFIHLITRFSLFSTPEECVAKLNSKPVDVSTFSDSYGKYDIKRHVLQMYAHSKFCMILFAMKLHREECLRVGNDPAAPNRVNTYAVHPGIISTGLTDYFYANYSIFSVDQLNNIRDTNIFSPIMKNLAQGTATGIYCAVSPHCALESGLYYTNCKPSWLGKSWYSNNKKLQDALWDESHRLIRCFEKGEPLLKD